MQHTALKQIKYNRGQVTDKLSERSDMGLQNACGVVYDNVYINRYGQLQNAPCLEMATTSGGSNVNIIAIWYDEEVSRPDWKVYYPLALTRGTGTKIALKIYAPIVTIRKPVVTPVLEIPTGEEDIKEILLKTDLSTPVATYQVDRPWSSLDAKIYQFGSNFVVYGSGVEPWLFNLISSGVSEVAPTVNIKDDYFSGAFDNIFVRGINTATPTGFTVPTSGYYFVDDDAGITTKKIITIKRNGAGSAFTQDLVGQVINCPQLSGAVQVREVVDGDTLKAYVISPLITASDSTTQININWGNGQSEWVFGYENPFSSTNGWPDSVCYVNQRLIFGGNDKYGNLVAASRIGVINDFDPSDATESDAFSASIAAPQYCRIVGFVQSNDELRIATTYGEYAVSLSALTPTGIIQSGFQLRSQVGVKKGTEICDCGGLTAYVSNDGQAIHITQFSLLQNKYAPISLTSQTEKIINNCISLKYLRNRDNDEGNLLIGLNDSGSVFGITIDTNAGLNAAYNIYKQELVDNQSVFGGRIEGKITKLFSLENTLFAQFTIKNTIMANIPVSRTYLVKFSMNRIFDLSYGYSSNTGKIELPIYVAELAFPAIPSGEVSGKLVAIYKDGEEYRFVRPTGYVCDDPYTDNAVATLTFADDIDQSKILTVGFLRQADWRSVELSLGLVTREANKRIVKLSGVVEPIKFYGDGDYIEERYSIPESDTYKFLNLVVGQDAPKLTDEQIDNPVKTIYTEGEDMSWRRGFDNPSRELHYGFTMLAPFLIKSTTALIAYDDVA